jgi:hypothetical protein
MRKIREHFADQKSLGRSRIRRIQWGALDPGHQSSQPLTSILIADADEDIAVDRFAVPRHRDETGRCDMTRQPNLEINLVWALIGIGDLQDQLLAVLGIKEERVILLGGETTDSDGFDTPTFVDQIHRFALGQRPVVGGHPPITGKAKALKY